MGLDRERILNKMAYMQEQVSALEDLLSSHTRDDIVSNAWIIKGVKYSVQTAIEALIDLTYHISAKKFSHAPTSARDALNKLAEEGVIPRERLATYSAMIGFRNRLVHGYQQVSDERLLDIVAAGLGDFREFMRAVGNLIERDRD